MEDNLRKPSGTHLSKGKGFTQVKKEFWYPVFASLAQCPAALRLMCWCLSHMDKSNTVFSRQTEIMAGTGMSRKSVYRALEFLESAQLLRRSGRYIHVSEQMFWEGREPVKPYFQKIISDPVIPEVKPAKIAAAAKVKAIR